ncbi:voltage-dependent calcium channel gamma-5 subunit [Diorhabda sublineata]|uniref:voltage-dependent calcium channel gamma-5 subunit n=1 Tax=Diorhabda sublineata TaxID=1163346 RepID=UPI0024E0A7A4|nr:voltage-dependent calcium channel gamma-5 subunit [Diorhabda sublineata]XP_056640611.1 voltage-dependent calcium channel gamma-5 subunit [Diorhabda sublineata]
MQRPLSRAAEASSDEEVNVLGSLEATLSCLWIFTPLSATFSLIFITVGISTNQWLHTSEKMPNPAYNGTGEKDYLPKLTVSGLWTFCFTNPGETLYQCSMIEYFSEEVYSPDPNDSSLAIPYTVTKSILFILLGSVFVLVGYVFCLLGQFLCNRSRFSLIAGVIFIQTGLAMLCGLIMYIAVFKTEVGSKLRPQSQLQPASFDYRYGYSFIIYVTGVVCTKITGVMAVLLFINRSQYEWKKKRLIEEPIIDNYNERRIIRHMLHPCKLHPEAYVNSNSAIVYSPYIQRELPYSNTIPCSLHPRRSQSNSLKDVSYFPDMFAPSTISYNFPRHLSTDHINNLSGFPRDATTITVSTTADIDYATDEYSPTMHEHEFARFDLERSMNIRAPSVSSLKSQNYQTDTLRRTTPV